MGDHTYWHKQGSVPGEPPPGIYAETDEGFEVLRAGMNARGLAHCTLPRVGTWTMGGMPVLLNADLNHQVHHHIGRLGTAVGTAVGFKDALHLADGQVLDPPQDSRIIATLTDHVLPQPECPGGLDGTGIGPTISSSVMKPRLRAPSNTVSIQASSS